MPPKPGLTGREAKCELGKAIPAGRLEEGNLWFPSSF
jgi:hypothetical protein